jgi:predicted RNase H-like nuclease (RuvC/YqgF family)
VIRHAATSLEVEVVAFLRDVAVPIFALFVLPIFLWYQRDRKKSRAEAAVAERTVGSDVASREVGVMGASVAFVNEAFRVERESKDREIKSLSNKVRELEREQALLEREHEEDKRKIEALEAAEEEKDRVIAELRRQLRECVSRVERLEDSTSRSTVISPTEE